LDALARVRVVLVYVWWCCDRYHRFLIIFVSSFGAVWHGTGSSQRHLCWTVLRSFDIFSLLFPYAQRFERCGVLIVSSVWGGRFSCRSRGPW